jgi:hypothetical protein
MAGRKDQFGQRPNKQSEASPGGRSPNPHQGVRPSRPGPAERPAPPAGPGSVSKK